MTGAEVLLTIGVLALALGGLFGYQLLCYRSDLARARRYRQWVAERERVLRELEGEPAPDADALTAVSGIGPHTAERLKEAGFVSLADLAAAAVEELARVPGFGPTRAREVIQEARRLLGPDAEDEV